MTAHGPQCQDFLVLSHVSLSPGLGAGHGPMVSLSLSTDPARRGPSSKVTAQV